MGEAEWKLFDIFPGLDGPHTPRTVSIVPFQGHIPVIFFVINTPLIFIMVYNNLPKHYLRLALFSSSLVTDSNFVEVHFYFVSALSPSFLITPLNF